jgi:hypothetical protein
VFTPRQRKKTNTLSLAARISLPEIESTRTNLCVSSSSAARRAAAAEEVEEMLSGDIPPNQTIYLNNLNEKVKKEGTALIGFHTPTLHSSVRVVTS